MERGALGDTKLLHDEVTGLKSWEHRVEEKSLLELPFMFTLLRFGRNVHLLCFLGSREILNNEVLAF